MTEQTYLLVPPEDIAALEVARQGLFALAESLNLAAPHLTHISQPMWRLTHTRYRTAAYRPRRKR